MSFSFWVVNLNGIEGLFSAVSRCYRTAEKVSLRCSLAGLKLLFGTYNLETLTPKP